MNVFMDFMQNMSAAIRYAQILDEEHTADRTDGTDAVPETDGAEAKAIEVSETDNAKAKGVTKVKEYA